MYCENCGKAMKDEAKYCAFCGSKVSGLKLPGPGNTEANPSEYPKENIQPNDNLDPKGKYEKASPKDTDINQHITPKNRIKKPLIISVIIIFVMIAISIVFLKIVAPKADKMADLEDNNSEKTEEEVGIEDSNSSYTDSETDIQNKKLVGTWNGSDDTGDISEISFYPNGTFELSGLGVIADGKFSASDNVITLYTEIYQSFEDISPVQADSTPILQTYELENNQLAMTDEDGNSCTLTKQNELKPKVLKYNEDSDSDTSGTDMSNPGKTDPDANNTNDNKIYNIGDTISVSDSITDMNVTVKSADIIKSDNTYLEVNIAVENNLNDNLPLELATFQAAVNGKVVNSDLSLTENNNSNVEYASNSNNPIILISPEATLSDVKIYFDVPSNTTINSCMFKIPIIGVFSGSEIKVNLGNANLSED